MPEIHSFGIMQAAGAGDVGEHPAGLVLNGKVGQMAGPDPVRARKLRCTPTGLRGIDVLSKKKQSGTLP